MITLPPKPPKDYALRDVNDSVLSSPQFTPAGPPRYTQKGIGKFLTPIPYADDEIPEHVPHVTLEPVIREKMMMDARASWVVEPGKDDFLIHEVYRRYTLPKNSDEYDPRFRHKENVFNRSYKYELDCTEAVRLEKLRQKCQREHEEFEGAFNKLVDKQREKEKPKIQVAPCKQTAPFWWKADEIKESVTTKTPVVEDDTHKRPLVDETCIGRWTEEPNLAGIVKDDPCRRKYEINLVGQPFKTEACNWYYKNYPSPDIQFRPKRFA